MLANNEFVVAKLQTLPFKNEEVKLASEQNFKYLLSESTQLIEILKKQQLHEEKIPLAKRKNLRIGICFNGRQTPGGNPIIEGLYRFTRTNNSTLLGFVAGAVGLFKGQVIEITASNFEFYANQGGYHFLGRSQDKIRTKEELEKTRASCQKLALDGLVLIGASHTFTDALILSNYFLEQKVATRIICVPATIDNNIGHHMLETVVGFDTASKVYSQLIGNIMIDAASAIKYWYFIRLMGRDPSHLVLECAL